jgi:hypothetical protein
MSLDIEFIAEEKYAGLIQEPIPAYKRFPEWYPKLDGRKCPLRFVDNEPYPDGGNLKNCPGITDYIKAGYIIPSWNTFTFREVDETGVQVNWIDTYVKTSMAVHPNDQFYTFLDEQKPTYGAFFKITGPWYVKTKPGVSIILTHPVWFRNKIFTSCTGVYHTDINACKLQWFFEFNKPLGVLDSYDDFDFQTQMVAEGEPIIQIIPFYRDSFKSKVNYMTSEKFQHLEETTNRSNILSKLRNKGLSDYGNVRRSFKNFFR